jgi:hypothetical protein
VDGRRIPAQVMTSVVAHGSTRHSSSFHMQRLIEKLPYIFQLRMWVSDRAKEKLIGSQQRNIAEQEGKLRCEIKNSQCDM